MWAQVLPNPEFAPVSAWLSQPERTTRQVNRYLSEFNLKGAATDGIAAFWTREGTVAGRVEESEEGYFQRISGGSDGGSLETGFHPPFYRTSTLVFKLDTSVRQPAVVGVSILDSKRETVAQTELSLSAARTQVDGKLTIKPGTTFSKGAPFVFSLEFEPGALIDLFRVQVFPDDHVDGWEPEVVALMKNARLPMLRFPGGNFASGYHWEDGVGPLERRPTLPNPAWKGVLEWNHVGTDEWLRLCELTGAQPLICINAGNGSAEEARGWVEYCNGSPETPLGRRRAKNGHPDPYGVRYWEIGNELYGSWQIGHTDAEGYADRYDEFVEAVRSADPTILIIANGRDADWNRTLVDRAETPVRSLSVHSLPGGGTPAEADPETVFREFMAHADAFEEYLNRVALPMKEAGLEPTLAVTELQVFTNRSSLPNNATLTEALWTAGIIHSCMRSGIVELLTHSAMLNHGGGLRKTRGVVYANPVWWTTHLYGTSEGVIPINTTVSGPTFSTEGKWLTKRNNVSSLDAMGLLETGAANLTLFLVSREIRQSIQTRISLRGFASGPAVQVTTLTGPGFMARNDWNRTSVELTRDEIMLRAGTLDYMLPPLSLTRFVFVADGSE